MLYIDIMIVQFNKEIIDLICSKGGKANCYDANGSWVGRGNGDLHD